MAVYYASPTGSDANNGLSTGAPKTLNGGYAACNPGDTLRLLPGTYQQKFSMNRSGTNGSPITVTSHDSGNKAVLTGGGTNVLASNMEDQLIYWSGDWNVLDGVEIKDFIYYSATGWSGQPGWGGKGITIEASADDNVIRNCVIHNVGSFFIVACGNRPIIEYNTLYDLGLGVYYYVGIYPPNVPTWGSGISLQTRYDLSQTTWSTYKNNGGIIRYNSLKTVYGEGIIAMRQTGATSRIQIYGNTVQDCMAPHLYITNSDNVDMFDNICSAPNYAALFGTVRGPGRGLSIGNEYPNTQNANGCRYLNIYNNLVYGTANPLTYFIQSATGGFAQLADTVIAFNHFIDGKQGGGGYGNTATTVNFTTSNISNVQFRNNVVTQTDLSKSIAAWNTTTGITFSHNRWSRTPGYTLGTGDSVGDPQIALAGSTNPITKEYFRPMNGSVLLNAGTPISGLTLDYEGATRSATTPTIGGLEGTSAFGTDWTTIPSPWTGADIGSPSPAGSIQYSPSLDQYRIISYNSADIWGTSDQFGYIYQSESDEWELVYKVESYSGGAMYAKFGCVLRTSLAANSASVGFLINPNFGTTQVPWRATDGATTSIVLEYATLDRWHKVTRSIGGSVAFSTSTDGVNWTYRSSISNTVVGTSPIYIGLAVCAQSASLTATGIFSNVSLNTSELSVGTITVDSSLDGYVQDAEISQAAGTIAADSVLVGYSGSQDIEEATGTILSDFDLVGVAFNDGDEFMATAQDIIRSALLLNGAVAADQTLSQTDLDDGLVTLNNMIESWSLDGTVVYAVTQYTTTTAAGVDSVVLSTRPLKILATRITDTAGIDHAIAEVGWDDYSVIANKAVQSAFPLVFWCDYAFPAPTVKFWPVPTYAYTVTFMVHLPFYGFDALDSTVVFPPGFERALRYNLAVEMAQYGGALPPKVEDIARESLMLLKVTNSRQTTLQNDSVFINRAGRTNIYSNIT